MNGLLIRETRFQIVCHRFPQRLAWGRRANLIKIVFWDGSGLCLFTKRLEEGRFPWPGAEEAGDTVAFTSEQLSMLIEGIDWRAPKRIWRPAVAG